MASWNVGKVSCLQETPLLEELSFFNRSYMGIACIKCHYLFLLANGTTGIIITKQHLKWLSASLFFLLFSPCYLLFNFFCFFLSCLCLFYLSSLFLILLLSYFSLFVLSLLMSCFSFFPFAFFRLSSLFSVFLFFICFFLPSLSSLFYLSSVFLFISSLLSFSFFIGFFSHSSSGLPLGNLIENCYFS